MPKYLCREGNHFLFRRRVPRTLQERLGTREIYRSLKTFMPNVAKQRAAALFLASEKLFMLANNPTLTDDDIQAAARHWLAGPSWRRILVSRVDELLPGDLRAEHGDLPERLSK